MCSREWREPAASGRRSWCVLGVTFVLPARGIQAGCQSSAPADLQRVQPQGAVVRRPAPVVERRKEAIGDAEVCTGRAGEGSSPDRGLDSGWWREGQCSVLYGLQLRVATTDLTTCRRDMRPNKTKEMPQCRPKRNAHFFPRALIPFTPWVLALLKLKSLHFTKNTKRSSLACLGPSAELFEIVGS